MLTKYLFNDGVYDIEVFANDIESAKIEALKIARKDCELVLIKEG